MTIAAASNDPMAPTDAEHQPENAAATFEAPAPGTWHVLVDFDVWLRFDVRRRTVTRITQFGTTYPVEQEALLCLADASAAATADAVREVFLAALPSLVMTARRFG